MTTSEEPTADDASATTSLATEAMEETMADEMVTIAGGCFWCVEAVYEELRGIKSAISGYIGGNVPNPTYEQVCSGRTGHAEAVQITFDPREISLRDIYRIFLTTHDPTTLNRQGPDSGTQYRSAIFPRNSQQKQVAQEVIQEMTEKKIWNHKIVTTLEPFTTFYPAEEYHQNYFEKAGDPKNPDRDKMNMGYCQYIIAPKVVKFRKQYADKLKKH